MFSACPQYNFTSACFTHWLQWKTLNKIEQGSSLKTQILCILGCLIVSHLTDALFIFYQLFSSLWVLLWIVLFLCLQVNKLCYSIVANLLLISSNVISTSDIVLLNCTWFQSFLYLSCLYFNTCFKISVTTINVNAVIIIILCPYLLILCVISESLFTLWLDFPVYLHDC